MIQVLYKRFQALILESPKKRNSYKARVHEAVTPAEMRLVLDFQYRQLDLLWRRILSLRAECLKNPDILPQRASEWKRLVDEYTQRHRILGVGLRISPPLEL